LNITRPSVVSAIHESPGCQPLVPNSSASISVGGRSWVSRTLILARTDSTPRSAAMMASAGEEYTPVSGPSAVAGWYSPVSSATSVVR
jgi:hypothetical protein